MNPQCNNHDTKLIQSMYIDGLVQGRPNSSALAMSYVFLARTHQYIDMLHI